MFCEIRDQILSFLTGKKFRCLSLKRLSLGNSDHKASLYSNGVVVNRRAYGTLGILLVTA